ncbi:MAG TPA: hypothetical protein VGL61_24245 [Kofleriaceae bacterium]
MLEIGRLRISRELIAHPLLGRAHVIEYEGNAITAMSELDWDRPTRIPAIASPGALPPGEGARLLNAIAERARDAGVPALRYAGPYPTPALYRTLLRSFRADGDEARFTANLFGRMRIAAFGGDPGEVPIDFTPAPHARIDHAHGWCELRDGIERAVIDGTSFEPDGSPGRLVDHAAEIWFGDGCYARIAQLSPAGELLEGPHAPPQLSSSVIGREFPAELRAALAELVADAVPSPIADDVRRMVELASIEWADLGTRVAIRRGGGFLLHAAIWERIAPLSLARVALAIAEALAPMMVGQWVDANRLR